MSSSVTQTTAKAGPRSLRAARATRTKFAWVTEHLARLPAVLNRDGGADKVLAGLDLSAFLQPLPMALGILRRQMRFSSHPNWLPW